MLVEPCEGLDHVSEERVAPHLTIGDDVQAGRFLQAHGLVDGAVFDALELLGAQPAGLLRRARLDEIRGTQETADDVAAQRHGGAMIPRYFSVAHCAIWTRPTSV